MPDNPVHDRDGGKCVMHGDRAETVHHRNHNHSDDRPSNRVSVCGSGTTGAHGWIEAHPAAAGLESFRGWTVSKHDPRPLTEIPVWMAQGPYGEGWYLLDDEYGFTGWPGSVATQGLEPPTP